MASSIVQKLLKKPFPLPSLKILSSFDKPHIPNSPLPPSLHHTPIPDPNPKPNPLPIYQSCPHWFSLEPISLHGLDRSGGEPDSDEDQTVIRADSVKKKRKRKMNKHKLKKLRKRLRRQT